MGLFSLHSLLAVGPTSELATNSAVGMIGSFLAAGALIVAPAAAVLILVSQNDALTRSR